MNVKAYRATMKRRIRDMLKEMHLSPWKRAEMDALLERLQHIKGEGLANADLRVVVRLYNRELAGRRTA